MAAHAGPKVSTGMDGMSVVGQARTSRRGPIQWMKMRPAAKDVGSPIGGHVHPTMAVQTESLFRMAGLALARMGPGIRAVAQNVVARMDAENLALPGVALETGALLVAGLTRSLAAAGCSAVTATKVRSMVEQPKTCAGLEGSPRKVDTQMSTVAAFVTGGAFSCHPTPPVATHTGRHLWDMPPAQSGRTGHATMTGRTGCATLGHMQVVWKSNVGFRIDGRHGKPIGIVRLVALGAGLVAAVPGPAEALGNDRLGVAGSTRRHRDGHPPGLLLVALRAGEMHRGDMQGMIESQTNRRPGKNNG